MTDHKRKIPQWIYTEQDYNVRVLGLSYLGWFAMSGVFFLIAFLCYIFSIFLG